MEVRGYSLEEEEEQQEEEGEAAGVPFKRVSEEKQRCTYANQPQRTLKQFTN